MYSCLQGRQLSFLHDVLAYELMNPLRRGEAIATRSGDIGESIDLSPTHPLYRYGVGRYHVDPAIDVPAVEVVEDRSPPEHQPRTRRHTPKGQACGWIETRTGNCKRKKPSVSHYYKWDDESGRGSRYIPAAKLAAATVMIYEQRRSVAEVLEFLGGDRP